MAGMTSNNAVEPGKIFVGGLSWETSKETLKAYFEKFGEITDSVIMVDPITKKPRGFGFVTFVDSISVEKCCGPNSGPHIIDSKTVDPKPATMKSATPSGGGGGGPVKKVFVGGISNTTVEDDIRAYFNQYGKVTDVDLKFDKSTGRMRGFGFVGFETEDVVEKLVQTHFHQINGKTVEVKKAEPRYTTASYSTRGGMSGGAGGGYTHAYQQQQYGGASGGGGTRGYSPYTYGANYANYGGQNQGGYSQYTGYGAYNQAGYNQYGGGGYNSYDRYSSGQQGTSAGEQARSDYTTGYSYNQQQMPSSYQDTSSYGSRSSYATPQDTYTQGTYNYSDSYPSYDTQAGATKGYARGGSSRGFPYGGR